MTKRVIDRVLGWMEHHPDPIKSNPLNHHPSFIIHIFGISTRFLGRMELISIRCRWNCQFYL